MCIYLVCVCYMCIHVYVYTHMYVCGHINATNESKHK